MPLLAAMLVAGLWPGAPARAEPSATIDYDTLLPAAQVDALRPLPSLAAEPCDASRWRLERRRRQLPEELAQGLRALGYYRPQIEVDLEPAGEAGCWSARVRLDPGPRVHWRRVDVQLRGEGRDDPVLRAIAGVSGSRPDTASESADETAADPAVDPAVDPAAAGVPAPGAPLEHAAYTALKSRLQNRAAERGYLDARFLVAELRVDPAESAAEARLVLDTGARYRLGPITVENGGLAPARVRALLGLSEDAPYEAGAITAAYQRLRDSGYFREVEVVPTLEPNAAHRVPLAVALTPLPAQAWRFGVGFDTDTGPRLSAGYNHRRLNVLGHQLDLNLRLSRDINELSGEYRIPGDDPLKERWAIQTGLRSETTADIRSDLGTLGVSYTHETAYPGFAEPLTEILALAYRNEHSRVGDVSQNSELLLPSVDWSWRPELAPGNDAGVRVGVKAAWTELLSDTSFAQLTLGLRGAHRLDADWSLRGRIDLGVSAIDGYATLPASQRFFAGGDTSIRGYGFKRLGPRDADGHVVGGRHLAVASVEVERRLTPTWGVATFVDAGNAFNDQPEIEYGYGIGARWQSPIGKVNLDFAIPSDTARDDFRLHFSLGASF